MKSKSNPIPILFKKITAGPNSTNVYEISGEYHVVDGEVDCRGEFAAQEIKNFSYFSSRLPEEINKFLKEQFA